MSVDDDNNKVYKLHKIYTFEKKLLKPSINWLQLSLFLRDCINYHQFFLIISLCDKQQNFNAQQLHVQQVDTMSCCAALCLVSTNSNYAAIYKLMKGHFITLLKHHITHVSLYWWESRKEIFNHFYIPMILRRHVKLTCDQIDMIATVLFLSLYITYIPLYTISTFFFIFIPKRVQSVQSTLVIHFRHLLTSL